MVRLAGIGIGGSSKVIYDVLTKHYPLYEIVGWFDDDVTKMGITHLGAPVLNTIDNIDFYKEKIDGVFVCVGATKSTIHRDIIFNKLKSKNIPIFSIVSKNAILSPQIILNEGCIILDGAIINAFSTLEKNVFLNTGCIIEHDCYIGASTFIAPGAVVCGNVKIEKNVFVGANAVIIGNIHIGANSTIGAGSVIISDVEPNSLIVGNPGINIKK